MTILVTGGAGYVGSHAVAALIARGERVVVLDNLQQGHREAVLPPAELVLGDLADGSLLDRLFRAHRFKAVMHFAAHSLVGESMARPLPYVGDNVANAVGLVRRMVDHGVARIVLSSTCAIFGAPSQVPIAEDAPIRPENPYGESKAMIERVLHWAEAAHGIRHAALRYFNAAGAHPDLPLGEDHAPETHLIPIALDVALGLRPHIEIFGDDWPTPDGTCVRDYVHVCDLADAHLRALDALDRGSRRYNLGTGRGHSVREVVDAVRRVTGARVRTRIAPRRPGDPPALVAAPDLIRRELGWEPRYAELDAIVATAWAWRRAHPRGYASRQLAAD